MAKIFIGRVQKGAKSFQTDIAGSFFSRLLGIMWQGTPLRKPFSKPLFFEFENQATASNSTHSMFCFVPYDAVFIDEDWIVIQVMQSIAPWNPWIVPKKPFKYLVEMPSKMAEKMGIRQGTKLSLKR